MPSPSGTDARTDDKPDLPTSQVCSVLGRDGCESTSCEKMKEELGSLSCIEVVLPAMVLVLRVLVSRPRLEKISIHFHGPDSPLLNS